MNILIPMAGRGARFVQRGYSFPKPLIDVDGRPMIQVVVESLGLKGRYIFLVLEEHLRRFGLDDLLARIAPNSVIVTVPNVTEGAACTALVARDLIDTDERLLIANSDQLVEWDPGNFFYATREADGGILTFSNTHPKWSYVRTDAHSRVLEVAEKRVISDTATVGIYYFRHGHDFVEAAQDMIKDKERINGEYYIAPTFNRLIAQGKHILAYPARRMFGLGTPEDLEAYQRDHGRGFRAKPTEIAEVEPVRERR